MRWVKLSLLDNKIVVLYIRLAYDQSFLIVTTLTIASFSNNFAP